MRRNTSLYIIARAARTQAHDRRNSAIHEAGHVVMASHVGLGHLSARLIRHDEHGDDERTWSGKCRFRMPPLASRRNLMLVAVAGMAAEEVWRERHEDEPCFCAEDLLCDPYAMSPSDWQMAGVPFGQDSDDNWPKGILKTVERAIFLLHGRLRPSLLAEARRLIVASRTSDDWVECTRAFTATMDIGEANARNRVQTIQQFPP